jgi:predicted ATP-grasp superfamily ATP-dependent carboligase
MKDPCSFYSQQMTTGGGIQYINHATDKVRMPLVGKLLIAGPNSIAYLGVICLDLLIQTVPFIRTGYLDSHLVEPIVGTSIYNGTDYLSTTFEVYMYQGFTVVQLRSNVIKGYSMEFSKQLASWIKQNEFESITIISGLDKRRRNDTQLTGYLKLTKITTTICVTQG